MAEELQFHAVGCYSAVSELKRIAPPGGMPAPHRPSAWRRLAQAWDGTASTARRTAPTVARRSSLDRSHDTLGGSSIKAAEDESDPGTRRRAKRRVHLADDPGRGLAAQIDSTGPGGHGRDGFNPAAHPRPPAM